MYVFYRESTLDILHSRGGGSLDILQRVTPCQNSLAEAPLEFLQSMTPRHGSLAEAPLEFLQSMTGGQLL